MLPHASSRSLAERRFSPFRGISNERVEVQGELGVVSSGHEVDVDKWLSN